MTREYIGIKKVLAWPASKNGQDGYAVKYPDGYISWSPQNAFETAYIPIDPDCQVTIDIKTADCKKVAGAQ